MDVQEQGGAQFRLTLVELQRALRCVKDVVRKAPLVPILAGMLFEPVPGGGGVVVRATDMANHAQGRVDAPVARGRRVLQYAQLKAVVAAIAKGMSRGQAKRLLVTIDSEAEDVAFVSAGPLRALRVSCYPADEFPAMPAEAPALAEVGVEEFAREVGRVSPVASRERELEAWRGLWLTARAEALELLASDQFRVVLGLVPAVDVRGSVDGTPVVAAPWAELFGKFAKLLDGERVRIGAEPQAGGRVSLATTDQLFVMRAVEGRMPAIPESADEGTSRIEGARAELLEAVKRAGAFASAYGMAAKGVRLALDADGLRVLPVHRSRRDEVCAPAIETEGSVDEASVVVDADRLAAGLDLGWGTRVSVDLHPGRPNLPLTLREADDDRASDFFRYVLMPIRDESRPGGLEAAPERAHVECDAGPLRDALELIGSGIPPALRSSRAGKVMLDGGDGTLTLRPAAGAGLGAARVPGARARGQLLLDHGELLGLVKAGIADLDAAAAERVRVEVVGAGPDAAVLKLREYALPLTGFPCPREGVTATAATVVGEVDASDLRRAVEHVRRSVGTKPQERQWFGVKLELRGALLTLVSTDRSRVAVAPIAVSAAVDEVARDAVVSLELLAGLVESARGPRVQLGWREAGLLPEVSLTCGGVESGGESLTAEFIAYEQAFEAPVTASGAVVREEMVDALKEATALARAAGPRPQLDVCFGPEGIVITPVGVSGGRVGGIQVCTSFKGLSGEHTATYVGEHLEDALASFDSPLVTLHVGDRPGPLLLTRAEEQVSDPHAFRYMVGCRRVKA